MKNVVYKDEKTKQIISNKKKGKYHGSQNKKVLVGKSEYFSLGEAAREFNITVYYRLNSSNFPEWQYK